MSTPQNSPSQERVWDKFLSDRDREHLALGWAKPAPFGLGTSPVLLIIDNQRTLLWAGPLPRLEAVRDFPSRDG